MARRVRKRTFLRSSQQMKCIISCKQPPPRSAQIGSKPSRWPPGLGSEGTPALAAPPEGSPRISSVQDQPTAVTNPQKGPRMGSFHLRRIMNVIDHLAQGFLALHCSLQPLWPSQCPPDGQDKLCGLCRPLTLSSPQGLL